MNDGGMVELGFRMRKGGDFLGIGTVSKGIFVDRYFLLEISAESKTNSMNFQKFI
jgi:hypothetical protein